MNAPRIFVSHSHLDDEFGLRLIADLRSRLGEDAVWYDSSGGLAGGNVWWDRIVAEITARDTFIPIFSPESVTSDYVRDELNTAWLLRHRTGKNIVPVLYRQCEIRADWSTLHFVSFDAPNTYDDALSELLRALDIADLPVAAPARVEPSAPAGQPAAPTEAPQASSSELVERMIHSAFGKEEWSAVITTSDLLLRETPQNMNTALWRERGQAFLALHDGPAALDALNEALRANPDDVLTLRAQGLALLQAGRSQEASAALERAYSLAPATDPALRLSMLGDLVEALRQQGDWAAVLRRVDDALRVAPDDDAWLRAKLDTLVRLNRASEAYTLARGLAPQHLTLVDPWLQQRYQQFAQVAAWQPAMAVVDAGLVVAPDDWTWRQAKLDTLRGSGQVAEATAYARDLTRLPGARVETWLSLAALEAAAGNEDAVRTALLGADTIAGTDNPAVAQARQQLLAPLEAADQARAQAEATQRRQARQRTRIKWFAIANALTLVAYILAVVGIAITVGTLNTHAGTTNPLGAAIGVPASLIYTVGLFGALGMTIAAIVQAIRVKQWKWAIWLLPMGVGAFYVGLPFLGPSLYFIWYQRDTPPAPGKRAAPTPAAAAPSMATTTPIPPQ